MLPFPSCHSRHPDVGAVLSLSTPQLPSEEPCLPGRREESGRVLLPPMSGAGASGAGTGAESWWPRVPWVPCQQKEEQTCGAGGGAGGGDSPSWGRLTQLAPGGRVPHGARMRSGRRLTPRPSLEAAPSLRSRLCSVHSSRGTPEPRVAQP